MKTKLLLILWAGWLISFTTTIHPSGFFIPQYPSSWPKPIYDFENKPLSIATVELGRKLFYDPILSKDSSISCASCHLSYTAFTHTDHPLSHGIYDSVGHRNAPSLVNLAWSSHFMWDGAIHQLDLQALAPINDPGEMGETTAGVVAKLQASPPYRQLFAAAFGKGSISGAWMLTALAHFQLTLISSNAKYDRVKAGKELFSSQEQAGYTLFQANCATCHAEPLFTNGQFENNGIALSPELKDLGRFSVSQSREDSLKFKVPTLRNNYYTKPYMHDGRYKSIRQVLQHYSKGPMNPHCTSLPKNGFAFSPKEQVDLIAFLNTLNDSTFLFNPAFSFPN